MKKAIFFISLIFICNLINAQVWTGPINISNIDTGDFCQMPDLAVDKFGHLHCVWNHVLGSNYSKVMYSKSTDNGQTWTTPLDVSWNDSIRIADPHIVADSSGKLHLVYDFNSSFYWQTKICYKYFDGNTWSDTIVLSKGIPVSWKNQLYIDHDNRIYCFWYSENFSNPICYKIWENGIWTNRVFVPYPASENYHYMVTATIDRANNIHCIGWYINTSHTTNNFNYCYFKYDKSLNSWSIPQIITDVTYAGGASIATDSNNNSHFVWRQASPYTGNSYDDSAIYKCYENNHWSDYEIISTDPWYPILAIGKNKKYVIQTEKINTNNVLVFYKRNNKNLWIGQILLQSNNLIVPYKLFHYNNYLHLLYASRMNDIYGNIYYDKFIIDTCNEINDDSKLIINNFMIFPNPTSNNIIIQYEINQKANVLIGIYNIQGYLMKEMVNNKQLPGSYSLNLELNPKGFEFQSGIYLIRLIVGNNIITRTINIVK